ncbi:hypothetical protein WJU16_19935 [Chitinophaga pollutisoli]|uniref:YD repeat-containing protein n=1 Tax=Chitinophaga pollutisoli TaxID=3133966 RepID=A0ABZ2YLM1_9BACT
MLAAMTLFAAFADIMGWAAWMNISMEADRKWQGRYTIGVPTEITSSTSRSVTSYRLQFHFTAKGKVYRLSQHTDRNGNGVTLGAGCYLVPAHRLATNYRFNTLNQVVAQHTPDANKSEFWYDRLGRLTTSQNAQQRLGNKYSYTLFDGLDRITEVGKLTSASAMNSDISRKQSDL